MLTNFLTVFARDVVTRLRLVFATIAVIVFSVTALSVGLLSELNRSVRNLTISSVDVYVKVEGAERSLKNLILLLQQVNSASTSEELIDRGRDLDDILALLRDKMSDLHEFQQTQEMSDEMARALQETETVANQIFDINMAVLEHQTTLAAIEESLTATRDIVRNILETKLFRVPDATPSLTVADAPLIEAQQLYSQELLRANAITSIGQQFDAVLNGMSRLRAVPDVNALHAADTDIRLKLRSITTLLTQIQEDTARTDLAQNLIEARKQLIGDAGAVSVVQSLLELQSELDASISSQLEATVVMSQLSAQLIENARGAIDRANENVGDKTAQMIWFLASASLAVLCVIAIATWVVVERQINRRMSKLTHGVLALAGGARNVHVDVQGIDELGKMAASLEVFKTNADELARSNSELEKFAYIAAHDLRSPLRAISDLTDWIVQDEENALSESSVEMMGLLDNRVRRMSNLLADLLQYSIAGTQADAIETVGFDTVVAEISDMLDHENLFEIEYLGDVETVTTFATPLRQILHNLVNNSIKHHDRKSGSISVSTTIKDGRFWCSVKDDGPGIDVKYQEKMFGLFQTLKPRDDVEGSGLGLAIIQKLVEHYGGSVTVISDPQKQRGATFEFDMPVEAHQASRSTLAA